MQNTITSTVSANCAPRAGPLTAYDNTVTSWANTICGTANPGSDQASLAPLRTML